MKKYFAIILVTMLAGVALAQPPGHGNGNGHGKGHGKNADDSYDSDYSPYVFSRADRDRISDCLMGGGGQGLPPGLAKRDSLPPGLQKHLQRDGQLPPGLQKKIQPMPRACEVRLPRLPSEYSRVILGNYVILRDIHDRIIDLFEYNRR